MLHDQELLVQDSACRLGCRAHLGKRGLEQSAQSFSRIVVHPTRLHSSHLDPLFYKKAEAKMSTRYPGDVPSNVRKPPRSSYSSSPPSDKRKQKHRDTHYNANQNMPSCSFGRTPSGTLFQILAHSKDTSFGQQRASQVN